MPRPPWSLFGRLVRRLPANDPDHVPDADLLARFTRDRDPAAFELLVWRHGSLVLGVCRRILNDEHLAEDAFQATFLVLARKAGSIRGQNIAGWLHRVARRVAIRAARKRSALTTRETVLNVEPVGTTPTMHHDWKELLDAEVARLPERFRLPVILCYLQDCTAEEAAHTLGIPRGTVLSRLSTARQRLSARLTKQGVTLPATLASVTVVSNQLVSATVRSAAAFAVGEAVLNSAPTLLATEVIRMSAWKLPAAVAASFALLAGVGTGIGVLATEKPGQDGQPVAQTKPADPPKATPPSAEEIDKQRAAKRETSLRRLRDHEDEVLARIRDLDKRRQEANQQMGDDVDVRVLMTSLERLDTRILQTESAISSAEAEIRTRERAVKAYDPKRIPRESIAREVSNSARLTEAKSAIRKKETNLAEMSKSYTGDAPVITAAKAEIESSKKELARLEESVLKEAEESVARRWREELTANVVNSIDLYKSQVNSLESQKKKRGELVQRIARARSIEDANQLVEDELRVYRELRQQLLRQRLLMQIDVEGLSLTPPAGLGTDSKVDQLMREVAELKSEVRRLSEAKPPTPQPGNFGRSSRGDR